MQIMDTTSKKFEDGKKNQVVIDKYQCPLCQIRFGTPGIASGMIKAQDGKGEFWTVCEKCFKEREGESLFKVKKLSKKERKKLKKRNI